MRKILALCLVLISLLWWAVPSDIIKLIVLQKPILFGRYSQGHFATLLLFTPLLWAIAAILFSKLALNRRLLINTCLLTASSIFSVFLVIWLSKFIVSPRYLEEQLSISGGASQNWQGLVRHRPPNKRYVYTQVDEPSQVRSYPNPPKGYPDVPIILSSDENGYRNTTISDQYDIVVLGDSFAAGSRVSDTQAWPVLLSELMDRELYNLGTSGTNIYNYISSLIAKGLKLNPKIVVLMIYEGNDFKRISKLGEVRKVSFTDKLKDSPLTASLKQLSRKVFEPINSQATVEDYADNFSWMPIGIESATGDNMHHYSFKPQRVKYLTQTKSNFEHSDIWQSNVILLDKFISLSKIHNFIPIIVYAPSKPHIVMPLYDVKAEELKHFLSYKVKNLPEAEEVKISLYNNLDAQELTVKEYCQKQGIGFISTTKKLQDMTKSGSQMYYTYDQHWTPKGNKVVAEMVYQYLKNLDLSSLSDSLTH